MKSFSPPAWSPEGHLHLAIQNLLLENNLTVLSLAYHQIKSFTLNYVCKLSSFFLSFYILQMAHIYIYVCVCVCVCVPFTSSYIYMCVYVCVCVCVCVRVREREREGAWNESIR